MITRWSYPSFCGDYTLEADGEHSVLIVTDPVAGEIEQLAKFISTCAARGWVAGLPGISPSGETHIAISAPIHEAAHRLLRQKGKPRPGVLTAVRSVAGVVSAVRGDGPELAKALAAPEASEAVTTRRPTGCCPTCVSGREERASTLLDRWLTPRQRESWHGRGLFHAVGGVTGHRYRIAHRRSPLAEQQGRPLFDETDAFTIHAHNRLLPPAEEALSLKLAVEHAEAWIRNPSTVVVGARHVLVNPFMTEEAQHLDGVADSVTVGGALGVLSGLLVRT